MRTRTRKAAVPTPVRAFGYASAAKTDGGDARQKAIAGACERLGLDLVDMVRDEGPNATARPGLVRVLERIDSGEASCLVVGGLDDLSGEVTPFASVLDRLEKHGTRLIAIDVGLDTKTDPGQLAMRRRPARRLPWIPEDEPEPEPALEPEPAPEPEPEPAAVETAPEPPPAEPPAEPPVIALPTTRAIGYASAPGSGDDRDDIESQRQAIERSCAQHGCELAELVADREPRDGKAFDRPGLSHALQRIAAGDASCLVVSGLERLSRSVAELGTLVHWLEENGVRLIAADIELDTASPSGRGTARALASVAKIEHDRLSERTRKGLAAARAKRHAGDPDATDWTVLRQRIASMRADGMTLQAIADVLNAEGVPTQRGGAKWRPSSVQTAAGYKRRQKPRGLGDLPQRPPGDSA